MKFLYVILGLLLFFQHTFAQSKYSLRGRVINSTGNLLEYFYATLNSSKDSSVLYSGAFVNGKFNFIGLKNNKYIISITSLGFKPYMVRIVLDSADTDLGDIKMEEISIKLSEAVITSSKKIFRQEKGQMIVSVEGTILSEAGSLIDVLKRSPGVIVDSDNTLKIFGKGQPIIYLDNREVISQKELETLQSSDIDKIIIDRNPSSKYSASGQSIILIKTKRIKKDQVSITIYNNSTLGRKLSNSEGIQLNIKKKELKTLLSYSYSVNNSKNYINSYEINYQPKYTTNNLSDIIQNFFASKHSIFTGSEYTFHTRHQIGIQFSGLFSDGNSNRLAHQKINSTTFVPTEKKINKHSKTTNNLYNTTLSYIFNPDSSHNNLQLILGYAFKNNRSDDIINETNLSSNSFLTSNILSSSYYNVYSSCLDYTFRLFNQANLAFGLKYSQISNEGNSKQLNRENNRLVYFQSNIINDQILGTYIKADHQLGRLLLSAGLRFEHTKSNNIIDTKVLQYLYNDFFPSMMFEYQFSKNTQISLALSRRINRPSFSQINPNKYYFDSLSYGVGNPLLKPEYSNNYDLSVTLNNFNIRTGYASTLNSIAYIATNDEQNPNILKNTYLNIKRRHSIYLGTSYSKSWSFYNGNLEYNLFKPFFSVPFQNKRITRNKPTWSASFNNTFTLTKNLKCSFDFQYQSDGHDGVTYYKETYNLSSGLVWKLLQQKLTLSLIINDILKTTNYNTWEDRYGNIVAGYKSNMDSRYIRLGIKYNFNTLKSMVKEKTYNREELNRL